MILVTGGYGQLGTELRLLLDERKIPYLATDSNELDITDKEAVEKFLTKHKPNFIMHCAAYTAVDKAEDEGKEACFQVNVEGTQNIAKAASKIGATVIYISTDYVFDGKFVGELSEEHSVNPISVYGETKYKGEQAIRDNLDNFYIVRTSWVFGKYGHNFVYTMLKLAEQCDKLSIVNDQTGRPTWTRTLAEFLLHLYRNTPEYGVYHLSNDGACTWYDFACEILKDKDLQIEPVTSEQFIQKASRPKYSVMSLEKAKSTDFFIPTWQEALKRMKEELGENEF
ncbi:dTDP-4-dehydrorhamnose reductase [Globicatella sp. PHS-GS-PNBC-21-1553]|uniref:dTDP-4-dehydrorhamnose reductase n=1 Tax=Globicatella sp. PHS-GS-PNBC-21-1553 TaxID=2885764 RepID=UPI00298EE367|nr:dTDP-4-dehydrorhamnose reductase [Globicatella sp. PHS-GS-PNBC-21-1553]WPC09056.1 dTDP-4-dehydrorhamnose reductase [Globicatella sp. PHS-GS-PNBC-21-1553]